MRAIILAGLALATAACGGGETEATDANTMGGVNMMMDGNVMMDANASMNGMTTGGANGAMDANTQNMMMQDATSNDADTNLANGM